MQQMKMEHLFVTSKNSTQQNLEKKRSKLLELCKTRTKKSSLDMLNFYLSLSCPSHGNWQWQFYHVPQQIQGSIIKNKYKKWKTFRKHGFHLITVWKFQTKKSKIPVLAWRTKQKKHKTPKAKTEHGPCKQEEIYWSKIEKSIQIQTVGTLQD